MAEYKNGIEDASVCRLRMVATEDIHGVGRLHYGTTVAVGQHYRNVVKELEMVGAV
jgi:hypothetical protein